MVLCRSSTCTHFKVSKTNAEWLQQRCAAQLPNRYPLQKSQNYNHYWDHEIPWNKNKKNQRSFEQSVRQWVLFCWGFFMPNRSEVNSPCYGCSQVFEASVRKRANRKKKKVQPYKKSDPTVCKGTSCLKQLVPPTVCFRAPLINAIMTGSRIGSRMSLWPEGSNDTDAPLSTVN